MQIFSSRDFTVDDKLMMSTACTLEFFYSFETFPRIIFFWNSPNIIIFTSKAFNKNFALVGLDWWFAFWSNFSFLTSFILETSCLDERFIDGWDDSGNKQWIIDHLKNIGSIGCVWGNIRLTLKFLNLKFVQFIKIFFWYETLQLQKKKKAKYNLDILLRITAAASALVEGSGRSLSEMVIMIVINYF